MRQALAVLIVLLVVAPCNAQEPPPTWGPTGTFFEGSNGLTCIVNEGPVSPTQWEHMPLARQLNQSPVFQSSQMQDV